MNEPLEERTYRVLVEAETLLYELRRRIEVLHEQNVGRYSSPHQPPWSGHLFDLEDAHGKRERRT